MKWNSVRAPAGEESIDFGQHFIRILRVQRWL
jgi:hypothetical protein